MKTRWTLLLLCGCAAVSVTGQQAQTTRPPRLNRAVFQRPPITATAVEPAALKMPDVRWLNQNEAMGALRVAVQRMPQFAGDGPIVIAQDPLPAADVGPNTLITVTLGVPKLSLSASNANPLTEEDVTFTIALDPPSSEAAYSFAWGDGSEDPTSGSPQATHRFSEAGTHEVTARARVREMEVGPVGVTISPVAPPPSDSTVTTATEATVTEPPAVSTEPIQPPADTTTMTTELPPAGQQPSPALPWQTIALIAIAVVAAAAAVRAVRRELHPPTIPPPPPVSMRSGLGSTNHTIQHPERISTGLSLRLRGGIRSVIAGEGGPDA